MTRSQLVYGLDLFIYWGIYMFGVGNRENWALRGDSFFTQGSAHMANTESL